MQLQFFQTYRNYFIFHDIITQNEKSIQILLTKHESSNEFLFTMGCTYHLLPKILPNSRNSLSSVLRDLGRNLEIIALHQDSLIIIID